MKQHFFLYMPDTPPVGGAPVTDPATPAEGSESSKGYIAESDADFLGQIKTVNQAWKADTFYVLKFATQVEFEAKIPDFEEMVRQSLGERGDRPGKTGKIEELDAQIDTGVAQVKRLVLAKFNTDEGDNYFPNLGLVRRGNHWEFPRDQDDRILALGTMAAGVAEYGITGDYNATFWQTMATNYTNAVTAARGTDQSVSRFSLEKKEARKWLEDVFQGLLFVLRGNNLDTYQEVYRTWGITRTNR